MKQSVECLGSYTFGETKIISPTLECSNRVYVLGILGPQSSVFQVLRQTRSPLFVTPTLSHTLTTLTSPQHFTRHPSLMHIVPIEDVLRPRAIRYSSAQNMYQPIFDRGRHTDPSCSVSSGTCRLPLQMLQFSPCCGVAISPNSPRMACQSLQIAQPLPTPPLIPAVPGATLTRPPRMCPLLPMIFPGCTSSIVMSRALQDQGALQFCSEMLLLTSDWLRYHCHLGNLFAGLNIRPSALASSCTQSAPLCTDFLCLLATPL
jgi:hypothetical protein